MAPATPALCLPLVLTGQTLGKNFSVSWPGLCPSVWLGGGVESSDWQQGLPGVGEGVFSR